MSHFHNGFSDELEKLAFMASSDWVEGHLFPAAMALLGKIPGLLAGGAVGAGVGAIRGEEGSRGKTILRDAAIGALVGGAATSAGLGLLGTEASGMKATERIIPGTVSGGLAGAGIGALTADKGEVGKGALRGGLIGAGLGTGLGGAYHGVAKSIESSSGLGGIAELPFLGLMAAL